ncbi:hypothetical protein H5410_056354 [Solanum commersonii]|uniref:Uncharacterized protein n=1 Tax=Solanum commersonii TaxID=4109 RepID=A0A9J5WM04_SOLCO|nr:hypothetical protein H5410_056354 [Solanum commersonii]
MWIIESCAYGLKLDGVILYKQFAQRRQVRKLQYIAELERNVQAFFCDFKLKWLSSLNFVTSRILSYNKALEQRLENLAHKKEKEKDYEHCIIKNINNHNHSNRSHCRNTSRNLDQQFANLTLKQKEAERDAVSRQLHI